jgi:parvulin-like peptidyl-prolyl isomerase
LVLVKKYGLAALLACLVFAGCEGPVAPTPSMNYTPGAPEQVESAAGDVEEEEIAVIVNGQPISLVTYQRELARFEAGQVALGYQVADQAGYQQQVLNLLVENELLRQLAAQQGIVITDEAVDAEINTMIAETGEDYFNDWLQSNYYTQDEFREVLRLDLLTGELLEPVVEAVPTTAEHVHARHILVKTEAEAQDILARLNGGEDFAALAAAHSVDVTTASTGGDLGWFPRGGLLVPEVEEAAFGQQPGQVSGVISSAWGFHIVETLEFDPAREIEFETRQRLLDQAIQDWRQELRDGADIQQLVTFAS